MSASTNESADFRLIMAQVAIGLLGEPSEKHRDGKEWRYGTRGSLSIHIEKGTFYDHESGCGGGALEFLAHRGHMQKPEALQWLRDRKLIPDQKPTKPKLVAEYSYHDPDGALLFQVCRYEPKNFRQRQPDGTGWSWNTNGVQKVIYRLPRVIRAVADKQTIFIAEGEKAVHAIESLGLVGTNPPGGAGKWRPEYNDTFAGADVVILADNDPQAKQPDGTLRFHPDGRPVLPGQDHAADVAKNLHKVAARVKVILLPGLLPKADVADWIASGGTREQLLAIAEQTPAWKPEQAKTKRQQKLDELEGWKTNFQLGDRGEIIPNLANAATALREAPELVGMFCFDAMRRCTFIGRTLPDSRMKRVDGRRPLQDIDVSEVQEWIQRQGVLRLGKEVTHQACELVSHEYTFHPVQDYLNGLTWDKIPRLDTWLSTYVGAEKTEYTIKIGRWFLLSMVYRIMRPGCKCDYMIVFEGEQGTSKSRVCAILAGEWFSDSLPELHKGDEVRISMHLRGKWLIEIAELSAIGKVEAGLLKSFITRTEEIYTPKFGRSEVIEPRQCVFAGTTNKPAYLNDETGDRRSWPVKTGDIDLDALERDRDQLFAEAMVAFQAGEQYWPDRKFEAEHIKPEQAARFVADEWESLIRPWLDAVKETTDSDGVVHAPRCTVHEVASHVLKIDAKNLGTIEQRRITAALERSGWVRKRSNSGRWWERGTVKP